MTQPNAVSPEGSLAHAGAVANVEDFGVTLAFGLSTEAGVELRRVSLDVHMADAIRPRARKWLASMADKTPVPYEVGYLADSTEVPYFETSGSTVATGLFEKAFPPANIPPVTDHSILLHADFLALILVAGNRRAALVKRITASKVVLKPDRKFFGVLSDNQTLVAIESPIIELDHSYHALLTANHAFMASVDESERLFGFEDKIAAKVAANIQTIAAVLPVSDADAFAMVCEGNKLYRKKLQSAASRGVFGRPLAELQAFVAQEGLPLAFAEQDGETVLVVENTSSWLASFLRFMDEDFVTGGVTSTKYLANSKRKR